jgi:hypothetical protein
MIHKRLAYGSATNGNQQIIKKVKQNSRKIKRAPEFVR